MTQENQINSFQQVFKKKWGFLIASPPYLLFLLFIPFVGLAHAEENEGGPWMRAVWNDRTVKGLSVIYAVLTSFVALCYGRWLFDVSAAVPTVTLIFACVLLTVGVLAKLVAVSRKNDSKAED